MSLDSAHVRAALQALLVTFLWSTSFVLIKIGLEDIPPLTFAGLRYSLAALLLVPLLLRRENHLALRKLTRRDWLTLLALGVLFYAVTQGTQFVALAYAPATATSLILSFTAVVVALLGVAFLAEVPTWLQWLGTALSLAGIVIYFFPAAVVGAEIIGIVAAVVGMLANSVSAVLGRGINRAGTVPALVVTVVSMGIGALLLLGAGIATGGLPPLSTQSWLIIFWLAAVNTAFAFVLWNHTLRTLSAVESTVINNTMTVQIAILAVLFLGERLSWQQVLGLLVAVIGTLMVQLRRGRRTAPQRAPETQEAGSD